MIILKKVDAIDVLNDLAEENSSLADLLYEIEERGKEDALGVLDAHVLVEGEDYLLLFSREAHGTRIRLDVHDVRGNRVLVAAAGRLRGVRAGVREQERDQHQR